MGQWNASCELQLSVISESFKSVSQTLAWSPLYCDGNLLLIWSTCGWSCGLDADAGNHLQSCYG